MDEVVVYKLACNTILKVYEMQKEELEKVKKELRKEKKQNRKLKRESEYYFDKSNRLLSDIMEIGSILKLESGTITYIKEQIREKYCSLDKGV